MWALAAATEELEAFGRKPTRLGLIQKLPEAVALAGIQVVAEAEAA